MCKSNPVPSSVAFHCRVATTEVGTVVLGTRIVFYNGKFTSALGFGSFLFCSGGLLVYLKQLKNKTQQKPEGLESRSLISLPVSCGGIPVTARIQCCRRTHGLSSSGPPCLCCPTFSSWEGVGRAVGGGGEKGNGSLTWVLVV